LKAGDLLHAVHAFVNFGADDVGVSHFKDDCL